MPWYNLLSDLDGENENRDICRAVLAISAEIVLIALAEVDMCGDVRARPVGDILNEHTST